MTEKKFKSISLKERYPADKTKEYFAIHYGFKTESKGVLLHNAFGWRIIIGTDELLGDLN